MFPGCIMAKPNTRFRSFPDFAISMLFNAHRHNVYRVAGYGGFVCIDIISCYHNLAALMLIFTFLSTLLKYMIVDALCILVLKSRRLFSKFSLRHFNILSLWTHHLHIFYALLLRCITQVTNGEKQAAMALEKSAIS